MRSFSACLAVLAVAAGWPVATVAGVVRANAENYLSAVRGLRAGDTLTLAPGTYEHGLPLHGLEGAPGQPITISGDVSGTVTVFRGRPGANTVSIKNSAHLVVRSLLLDGAGLDVDAVKAEGTSRFAHHITLENLTIINHGADQQLVGISTKCPAWGWVIRGNVIRGAGTGMYLGNSDGSAPFIGGLIEGNLVVDTVGYNLQIKHQLMRPAIMPPEPMRTVIRHNVFSKGTGGSDGKMARPNVLLGHFPPEGAGADDSYEVYGNFFHENPNESLLQAEGNVMIHDNIFLNGSGDAIRIQAHHAPLRGYSIRQNTVVASGTGIRLSGADSASRREVAANAVFAGKPIAGDEGPGNIVDSYRAAERYLRAPFAVPGQLDFSPLGGRLDLTALANGVVIESEDFYGWRREYPSAGAIVPGMTVPRRLGLSIQSSRAQPGIY